MSNADPIPLDNIPNSESFIILIELLKSLNKLEYNSLVYIDYLFSAFFQNLVFHDIDFVKPVQPYVHSYKCTKTILSSLLVFKVKPVEETFCKEDFTSGSRINHDKVDQKKKDLNFKDIHPTLQQKHDALEQMHFMMKLVSIVNDIGTKLDTESIKLIGIEISKLYEESSKSKEDIYFTALINNIVENIFLFKYSIDSLKKE